MLSCFLSNVIIIYKADGNDVKIKVDSGVMGYKSTKFKIENEITEVLPNVVQDKTLTLVDGYCLIFDVKKYKMHFITDGKKKYIDLSDALSLTRFAEGLSFDTFIKSVINVYIQGINQEIETLTNSSDPTHTELVQLLEHIKTDFKIVEQLVNNTTKDGWALTQAFLVGSHLFAVIIKLKLLRALDIRGTVIVTSMINDLISQGSQLTGGGS